MPIYEYERPDGTTFDVMQSFEDEPLTEDPDSGVPVRRVFHAPAVHFKGKGFYNTDYGTRRRQREMAAQGSSSSSDGAASSNGKAGGDGGGSSSDGGSSADAAKPAADSKPKSEKGSAKAVKPETVSK
jgi:putative FmdB family regulatory protein